ncbi:MAG: TlpA disulfide reductase family protein [Bacteroides sp.]
MKKMLGTFCLLILFVPILRAQTDKLPALLKEKRSGKVMFNRDNAIDEIKRQRLAHSSTIWDRWGGKPCPVFAYKDLNGVLWTNENIRGKVTLINFWHTEGAPCIRQIPWLNKLLEKFSDVNFIACTFNDAAQIKKVVEQTPYLYHQLTDALPLFQEFGIVIMPTTIILDKEGKVFAVVTGTNDTLKHTIEAKLKENF